MLRAGLVIALILATMVVIKDGRILRDTGVLSSCAALTSFGGDEGYWQACRPGKLEGRPDLSRRSCISHGLRDGYEYWRCPERVGTAARKS